MNVGRASSGERLERRRRLAAVAGGQQGIFDRPQAVDCGFDDGARSYHRRVGNWLPTSAPNVWRLAEHPETETTELAAWLRWFDGAAQATGWSALSLLGIRTPSRVTEVEDGDGAPGIALEGPGGISVHLVLDEHLATWRTAQSRSRRAGLDAALSDRRVTVHRVRGRTPAVEVAGLPSRPLAESVCVAVCHRRGRIASTPREHAVELLHTVLDGGLTDVRTLWNVAVELQATRVFDLLEQ